MRGLLLFCILLGLSTTVTADDARVSVIPKPWRVNSGEGTFQLTPQTKILVPPGAPKLRAIGQRFADRLSQAIGHTIAVEESRSEKTSGSTILLTDR